MKAGSLFHRTEQGDESWLRTTKATNAAIGKIVRPAASKVHVALPPWTREGGRAAHQKGTAHEFTSEEARRAGSMSHKNDGNRQSGSRGNASRAEQPASQGQQQVGQEYQQDYQGNKQGGDKY
jgi:hypothetical protein